MATILLESGQTWLAESSEFIYDEYGVDLTTYDLVDGLLTSTDISGNPITSQPLKG